MGTVVRNFGAGSGGGGGAPSGPAGGELDGTYPNPTIKEGVILPGDVNSDYVNGDPSFPSLRSLGTTSNVAMAGDDSRVVTMFERLNSGRVLAYAWLFGNSNTFANNQTVLLTVRADIDHDFKLEYQVDNTFVPTPDFITIDIRGMTLISDIQGATFNALYNNGAYLNPLLAIGVSNDCYFAGRAYGEVLNDVEHRVSGTAPISDIPDYSSLIPALSALYNLQRTVDEGVYLSTKIPGRIIEVPNDFNPSIGLPTIKIGDTDYSLVPGSIAYTLDRLVEPKAWMFKGLFNNGEGLQQLWNPLARLQNKVATAGPASEADVSLPDNVNGDMCGEFTIIMTGLCALAQATDLFLRFNGITIGGSQSYWAKVSSNSQSGTITNSQYVDSVTPTILGSTYINSASAHINVPFKVQITCKQPSASNAFRHLSIETWYADYGGSTPRMSAFSKADYLLTTQGIFTTLNSLGIAAVDPLAANVPLVTLTDVKYDIWFK